MSAVNNILLLWQHNSDRPLFVSRTTKDVDDATLSRLELERKIESLMDEIEFLKKLHDEVRDATFSLVRSQRMLSIDRQMRIPYIPRDWPLTICGIVDKLMVDNCPAMRLTQWLTQTNRLSAAESSVCSVTEFQMMEKRRWLQIHQNRRWMKWTVINLCV